MASIELTDSEAKVLKSVLESYMRDVSTEISNTEKFELREELKRSRDLVRKIVLKL